MSQKISSSDIKQMAYAVASRLIEESMGGQMLDHFASEIVGAHFAAGIGTETDISDEDLDNATDKVIGRIRQIVKELNDRAESFGGFF